MYALSWSWRHATQCLWLPMQVFHPAMDETGHVDMSLLVNDWRPDM